MAHPASITDEQVFCILDRLDALGVRITPNRVRTEAGGGNPARYRILIERWHVARSLARDPGASDEAASRTALFDEIARTIEVGLFMGASFLDRGFRTAMARDLAGQVGSSLIRRGLVSEDALGEAPPDPLQQFLGEALADGQDDDVKPETVS